MEHLVYTWSLDTLIIIVNTEWVKRGELLYLNLSTVTAERKFQVKWMESLIKMIKYKIHIQLVIILSTIFFNTISFKLSVAHSKILKHQIPQERYKREVRIGVPIWTVFCKKRSSHFLIYTKKLFKPRKMYGG